MHYTHVHIKGLFKVCLQRNTVNKSVLLYKWTYYINLSSMVHSSDEITWIDATTHARLSDCNPERPADEPEVNSTLENGMRKAGNLNL